MYLLVLTTLTWRHLEQLSSMHGATRWAAPTVILANCDFGQPVCELHSRDIFYMKSSDAWYDETGFIDIGSYCAFLFIALALLGFIKGMGYKVLLQQFPEVFNFLYHSDLE